MIIKNYLDYEENKINEQEYVQSLSKSKTKKNVTKYSHSPGCRFSKCATLIRVLMLNNNSVNNNFNVKENENRYLKYKVEEFKTIGKRFTNKRKPNNNNVDGRKNKKGRYKSFNTITENNEKITAAAAAITDAITITECKGRKR